MLALDLQREIHVPTAGHSRSLLVADELGEERGELSNAE